MASVKDLTPFGINLSTCRLISEEDYEVLVRQGCRPEVGDVLISKDGASALDTVCEIRSSIDAVLLSSVAILRPDPSIISSSYLHYYLDAEPTRQYMKNSFTTGAAIPRVVLQDFKRTIIRFPPLPTQRKIAAILSAYDDLIENNLRRIAILEEMARLLFREWFVNFRFPGHESIPLVDSTLGPIPEGWEVVSFENLLESYMGGDWGSEERTEEDNCPVVVIRGTDIKDFTTGAQVRAPARYITENSLSRRKLKVGDVIVENSVNASSRSVGTSLLISPGILRRIQTDAICASFSKCFRPKDQQLGVLIHLHLQYLRAEKKMEFYQNVATNGIANFQATRFIEKELIAIPSNLELLSRSVGVLDDLCSSVHADRTDTLRRTRELLLPRLISGDLDVSDLPIATGEEDERELQPVQSRLF